MAGEVIAWRTARTRPAPKITFARTAAGKGRLAWFTGSVRAELGTLEVPPGLAHFALQGPQPSLDGALYGSLARVADGDLPRREAAKKNGEARPGEGKEQSSAQSHS